MKKETLLTGFLLVTLFITGCGITEELDQAKEASKELKTTLTAQKKSYQELASTIEAIIPALEHEQENPQYAEHEGDLYENVQARKDLIKDLAAKEKELLKIQNQLDHIVKRNGVDVDNKKLKTIIQSLDIVLNNFESLRVYTNTGFKQEKELYKELPIEEVPEQDSIVERTYGSILLVIQESQANIDYTLNLLTEFEKSNSSQK